MRELEWSDEERDLIRAALLEAETVDGACPGRDDDIRRLLQGSADAAFREHLLGCFACWSTLRGEIAARRFGDDTVDRLSEEVRRAVLDEIPLPAPDRPALDHPEPLLRMPDFVETLLDHPPFSPPAPGPDGLQMAFSRHSLITPDRLMEAGTLRSPRRELLHSGVRRWLKLDEATGDFSPPSLRRLDLPDRNRLVLSRAAGKTLVLALDDDHARALIELVRPRGPGAGAAAVLSGTPPDERLRIAADFASGILSMVIEGDPDSGRPTPRDLETLILARPTRRPDRFARMLARAWPALEAHRPLRIVEIRDRIGRVAGLD